MQHSSEQLRKTIQNLIDLKGEDFELVGPDLLTQIDEVEDDYKDQINVLEEKNSSLSSQLQDMADKEEEFESQFTVDTGLDKLSFHLEHGNLHDTQVVEAVIGCYEKGIKPLTIAGVLEGLSKN